MSNFNPIDDFHVVLTAPKTLGNIAANLEYLKARIYPHQVENAVNHK